MRKKNSMTGTFAIVASIFALATAVNAQLIGHWSFDTSDQIAGGYTDASGFGIDVTTTNGPAHSTADTVYGTGAVDFEADNHEYLINTNSAVDLRGKSFTVSYWFKRESLEKCYTLAVGEWQNSQGLLQLGFKTNNITKTVDYWNDSWNRQMTGADDTNNWHHFVLTFNAATLRQEIWTDGVYQGGDKAKGLMDGIGSLSIGANLRAEWAGYVFPSFDGLMDELWIFETNLSEDEIQDLYNSNTYAAGGAQSAYSSNSLPGRIEAEDYDSGGTGAAYFDSTPGNAGDSTYRTGDDVDLSLADGGDVVSHITDGEWLEYTVESITNGLNILKVRVASTNSASIDVYADWGIIGSIDIPDTGALTNWQDITTSMNFPEASNTVLRLQVNDGGFNLNWFEVYEARIPYSVHDVPAKIEFEHYDIGTAFDPAYYDTGANNQGDANFRTDEGVDIINRKKADGSNGAGMAIGYTQPGEWIEYTIPYIPAGMSVFDFCLAGRTQNTNGESLTVYLDGVEMGAVEIPNNGWQVFEQRALDGLTISEGSNRVVRIEFTDGQVNADYFSIHGDWGTEYAAHALPGRVEFEDYDLGGQWVGFYDKSPDNNQGGNTGYRSDDGADINSLPGIGFNDRGEWLNYTVDIGGGVNTMTFRLASPQDDKYFIITANGQYVGKVDVPNTGGWNSYTNIVVEDMELPSGSDVRIRFDKAHGGFNLDWFEASAVSMSYANWAAAYSMASNSAATDDYDLDSFENLYEYAFNGNPTDGGDEGGTAPVFTWTGNGYETMHIERNDDTNLVYEVQTCDNLSIGNWQNSGVLYLGTNLTGTDYDEVTNSVPVAGTQLFIRVKVDNN